MDELFKRSVGERQKHRDQMGEEDRTKMGQKDRLYTENAGQMECNGQSLSKIEGLGLESIGD